MKNITVTVENDVYAHARRLAAARNTSVSALVKQYLASLKKLPTSTKQERLAQIQAEFAEMPVEKRGTADKLAGYSADGTFE